MQYENIVYTNIFIIFLHSRLTIIFSEKCRKIQIKTKDWGHENSYSIGECVSKKVYAAGKTYKERCCLTPGKYNLVCKDSFQDGWHGGYLKIKGKKYCDDFLSGNQKTVQVDWS